MILYFELTPTMDGFGFDDIVSFKQVIDGTDEPMEEDIALNQLLRIDNDSVLPPQHGRV